MTSLGPCGIVSQHFESFRLRLPIAYVEPSCTFSKTEPVYLWRREPQDFYRISDSFEAKAGNDLLNLRQPL
jgi:hypothetical protein